MNIKMILFSLSLIIFFSCEKEASTISTEPHLMLKAEGAEETILANRQSTFNLCFDNLAPEDVAGITTCSSSFPLETITETLPFSHFNTHDLINELNDIFYCHDQFSTCQGAQLPQEICTITFSLYDTKVFTIPTPAFPYFSDAIAPAMSNQIMQHFACEMTDYGDQNYGNYQIAHVRFDYDQLLCNTCSNGIGDLLYLTATVHYYIY